MLRNKRLETAARSAAVKREILQHHLIQLREAVELLSQTKEEWQELAQEELKHYEAQLKALREESTSIKQQYSQEG